MTKNKDLFWGEMPKTNRWKKIAIVTGSIIVIISASFGVASAKFGYENVTYFVTHGHIKPAIIDKHLQTISNEQSSSDENKTASEQNFNWDSSIPSTGSKNTALSDSSFWDNSDSSVDSGSNSSTKSKNSNSGFVTPPEYESAGAIAICNDYTYSHEQHSSTTCSSHGGVMYWLDASDSNTSQKKKVCIENTAMKELLQTQYQNQINSIKQQETYELGQARVDLANRGIDGASGLYLSTIQSIENKYDQQLSSLEIEYDQKINGVESICHYE